MVRRRRRRRSSRRRRGSARRRSWSDERGRRRRRHVAAARSSAGPVQRLLLDGRHAVHRDRRVHAAVVRDEPRCDGGRRRSGDRGFGATSPGRRPVIVRGRGGDAVTEGRQPRRRGTRLGVRPSRRRRARQCRRVERRCGAEVEGEVWFVSRARRSRRGEHDGWRKRRWSRVGGVERGRVERWRRGLGTHGGVFAVVADCGMRRVMHVVPVRRRRRHGGVRGRQRRRRYLGVEGDARRGRC